MSRTYRIRHLPTLGIARKFAFSTNAFSWYKRWPFGEKRANAPIISPHYHPCVSHAANTPANGYYRKLAHQRMRRREKYLLNRSGRDFDDMVMPAWYEFWDVWDIC
jgi:ribosomal protein S18 acetylase RimI-like enzyme